jgi:hypothetical protein
MSEQTDRNRTILMEFLDGKLNALDFATFSILVTEYVSSFVDDIVKIYTEGIHGKPRK